MKPVYHRSLIWLCLAAALAACTAPVTAPAPTQGLPATAAPAATPYPQAMPASPTLPVAYPAAPAEPPGSPYPAPPEAPTQSAYPSPQAAPAVQIPAGVYTCNLQGSSLPAWRYEIVQTYPHDREAYTQGLIVRDGVLYEGTGLRGRSTLRKVALESGEVLQSIDLPEQFFGEGIAEMGGKIYQITWQEKTGFIYDFNSFEKLGEFHYATDGWGLTHDGRQLILTDGADQLYFIDPNSLQLTGQVAVSDDRGPVYRINELEFVDGEVWGNIYQTACIARIDPQSGKVTGWIDLTGLHDLALQAVSSPMPPEVPNGIAYDAAGGRIFVTGKFWPTLYEIRLVPVEAQP